MSSLTAIKAAIDLVNWDDVGYSRIKSKMDELLDSIDSDIDESEMDESSQSELIYGQLRKLLDEEQVLSDETIADLASADEEVEDEVEVEVELDDEDEDEEEEEDIEYEDEDESEAVETVEDEVKEIPTDNK